MKAEETMNDKQENLEAIVFAEINYYQAVIKRALDSSYDRYDVEFGWSPEDFKAATGPPSREKKYNYNLSILYLTLDSTEDKLLGFREGFHSEYSFDIKSRGDCVVFHKTKDKLIDAGKYGIFNTLTNEKLSDFPNNNCDILACKDNKLFVREKPSFIFMIDLDEGMKNNIFYRKRMTKEEFDYENKMNSSENEEYRFRHFQTFDFFVNEKKYSVENQDMDRWENSGKTRIIDDNGKIILKKFFSYHYISAIGFPEKLLTNNKPKIKLLD